MAFDTEVAQSILDDELTFYTDRANTYYAYVEYPLPNGSTCFAEAKNERFLAFLDFRYRELTGDLLCPPMMGAMLEAKIRDTVYLQNSPVTVNRRLAGSITKGKIMYHLGDEHCRSVLISASGWKIGIGKKTKFLTSPSDLPQVLPIEGGNLLSLLKPTVNLEGDDYVLFVVCLVQAFSRDFDHMALIISAGPGSGKTTISKVFRELVDPSKSSVNIMPGNAGDLVNSLVNSYIACFDNTEQLSVKYSNILCASITGSNEAKRKLYSNCDEIILKLHNQVILNGINVIPKKSDFVDRSLLFSLPPISEKKRMAGSGIQDVLKSIKPQVLGAIFDTLAKAMQILPTLKDVPSARMYDAKREMTAIAVALGIDQDWFHKIFEANRQNLRDQYAAYNPLVEAIVNFMGTRSKVSDYVQKLYSDVEASIVGSKQFFPKSPSLFSRRLNEEIVALKDAGFFIEHDKDAKGNTLTIKRIPSNNRRKNSSQVKR